MLGGLTTIEFLNDRLRRHTLLLHIARRDQHHTHQPDSRLHRDTA